MKARVFSEWGAADRSTSAGSAGLFFSLRDCTAPRSKTITGMLSVRLSDAELEERYGSRMPERADRRSGTSRKGAAIVGPAEGGALTDPGRAGETDCHAHF